MSYARFALSTLGVFALAAAAPAMAQEAPPVAAPSAKAAPKLIVAISVDQYGADLFAGFRQYYTGGLARLQGGAVFPSGFQSHAATETCPGHSTLLTGAHPARTGIVANTWVDFAAPRSNKFVYCVEDESAGGAKMVVSAAHLKVPTLGEYMKRQWPTSRNVAVSVKDRAAVMMSGHGPDGAYWLEGAAFTSYAGKGLPASVVAANARLAALLAKGAPAMAVPAHCVARAREVQAGALSVGTGRFTLNEADKRRKLLDQFRASPRADGFTLEIAAGLVRELKLGKGEAPDILSVSLSATDYIGHGYGTQGLEMCIQQAQLDRQLGVFLAALDASGVDYAVVLTADHGGIDLPERLNQQGVPQAQRALAELSGAALGKGLMAQLGMAGENPVVSDGLGGDYWINPDVVGEPRARLRAALVAKLRAHPQVEAVFTREEIMASPMPVGAPQEWSALQKIRASYDPERSGEVYAVLHRAVVPVSTPKAGATTVTSHGTVWDYDRRVPMLFWRKGMAGFEQPEPVETVDIAPTLAGMLGLKLPEGTFDGRCLDVDAGPQDSCGK